MRRSFFSRPILYGEDIYIVRVSILKYDISIQSTTYPYKVRYIHTKYDISIYISTECKGTLLYCPNCPFLVEEEHEPKVV